MALRDSLFKALEMSVHALDADNAGYLGHQELAAVRELQFQLNMSLQESALRLLASYSSVSLAMQVARSELRKSADGSQLTALEADDEVLIENFLSQLEPIVVRWAATSEKRRKFEMLIHDYPTLGRFVIVLIITSVGGGIIMGITLMLES